MAEGPKVAPFESCVACFKGDVTTGLALRGEPEFAIAAIHVFAGIPIDQATATFLQYAESEPGAEPGEVPDQDVEIGIRLCRECAEKTGAKVGELPDLPGIEQRDDTRREG